MIRQLIFSAALAAASVTPMLAAAQSSRTTTAHLKPELLFAVNMAVMERCIQEDRIQIALQNAAFSPYETVGQRDAIRIINSCERTFALPRRKALAYVGSEALQYGGCDEAGACTSEEPERVARTAAAARDRFKEHYAALLLHNIRETCSSQTSLGCERDSVKKTNGQIGLLQYPWMNLNTEARITSVFDPSAPGSESEKVDLDEYASLLATVKRLSATSLTERAAIAQMKEMGFTVKDNMISLKTGEAQISSANGFLRTDIEVEGDRCLTLVSEAAKIGSDEILLNGRLVTQPENATCNEFRNRFAAAFRMPQK